MTSKLLRLGFLIGLVSAASVAQAEEFKWQQGLEQNAYEPFLDLSADTENLSNSGTSPSLDNGGVQLDSGYFASPALSAPGAVDTSFSGLRLRLSIDGR